MFCFEVKIYNTTYILKMSQATRSFYIDEFNMSDVEPPIIFIPDVYVSDCTVIDDIFERSLMENIDNDGGGSASSNVNIMAEAVMSCKYDKLPSTFRDVKSWPKHTNLLCWTCHRSFDTKPLFLPKTIEQGASSREVIMTVEGCFCCYSHIVDYILLRFNSYDQQSKMKLIEFLYLLFEGKKPKKIRPSISIYTQEQYGGKLTRDQYDKIMSTIP